MNESRTVFINADGTSYEVNPAEDRSLLDVVRAIDPTAIDAPCGGAGTCGKCRVHILAGDPGQPGPDELRRLKAEELAAGIRLACRVPARGGIMAERAVSSGRAVIRENFTALSGEPDPLHSEAGAYGVAIDIGTTTVAAYLVDFGDERVAASASCLNSQKAFGADVIARIDHAGKAPGNLQLLADLVRGDIQRLTEQLLEHVTARPDAIREFSVVGNTTMLHLFTAVDPAGIAVAPFTPVFTAARRAAATEFGLPYPRAGLTIGPSVAAYVGADLVAAVRASGIEKREKLALVIDLGTNGEMALGNRTGVVACATAAGPAFEGAAISFGTGGVAGAIDALSWENGRLLWTTIGGGAPIGICGSGIIDAAACLVRAGITDETGAMHETWAEEGYPLARNGSGIIRFTQADVRQIQLAKAAVAAGIGAMLEELGADFEDIEQVYLAGGFGSYLRPESAATIGLIPPPLLPKVQAIGNAAGHGAVRMLLWHNETEAMTRLVAATKYLELSGSDFFRDRFVEELFFPEPADPVVPLPPAPEATGQSGPAVLSTMAGA
jgi:uncharacterized 2Fe-2S/4Fe-4S cluster protein (DUF4445 family)